jgi:hypothetical protein
MFTTKWTGSKPYEARVSPPSPTTYRARTLESVVQGSFAAGHESPALSHELSVPETPPGSPALGQLRSLSIGGADVCRWTYWVLDVDAIGRITLPVDARRVAADRSAVRVASQGWALVLRPDGLGAPTHVDRRGRLFLPGWLRRLVEETGTVLAAARRPDASLVVVTPTTFIDELVEHLTGEVA